MSMLDCGCPRDQLCAACVGRALSWHAGPAHVRGDRWATDAARLRPELVVQPWPPRELADPEHALGLVRDLTVDARVVEMLAAHVHEGARAAWLRAQSRRWTFAAADDGRCCVIWLGQRCELAATHGVTEVATQWRTDVCAMHAPPLCWPHYATSRRSGP